MQLSKEHFMKSDIIGLPEKSEKDIILQHNFDFSNKRAEVRDQDKSSISAKKRNITILYDLEAECMVDAESETGFSRRSVALQTNLRPKYESKASQCCVSKCI